LAYPELLADEKAATPIHFLIRAVSWFARHSVTNTLVTTDNGNGYRVHLFLIACHSLGANSIKPKPYLPRTNDKA
jgi:hypothetical protein